MTQGPAYSFGLKSGKFKDDCSPGPAHFPDARLTRHGKDGTPAYSLYSRHADKNNFNVPGAGTYRPEDQKVMEGVFNKQPQYTFGIKHKYRGSDNTPGELLNVNEFTVQNRSGLHNKEDTFSPYF